jgi:transcriptional regulator with XRE-family HTH domain
VKTFSDRLKHARLLRGHTQKALARLVRISQSAIGSYESGLRHSSRSARKLAQVLKIEVEWLETGKGPMELPLDASCASVLRLRDSMLAPAPA